MAKNTKCQRIPVNLTLDQFDQFFCHHLSSSTRGRKTKISNFKFLRYILRVLYTGMQWISLQIDKDISGKPEIHYTNVYKRFKIWSDDGSLAKIFESTVCLLQERGLYAVNL